MFRCELDGSGLELFATGLRNPQELVFDAHGNLFTGDNNSDGGDRARWVHVVEGGDSGWRIGFQYIEEPRPRGPWNVEKMWHERWEGQPAHLLPPVKLIGVGPGGRGLLPGHRAGQALGRALLPGRLSRRPGEPERGPHLHPDRPRAPASPWSEAQPFVWGVLTTDFEFGPDGAAYLTDWVQGWPKPGKGRLWRVFDPGAGRRARQPRPPAGCSAEGMAGRSPGRPGRAAGARRPARAAGGAAAAGRRGARSPRSSRPRAGPDQVLVARLHAVWGLGQLLRAAPKHRGDRRRHGAGRRPRHALSALLADPEAEVRAQAARALGDGRAARRRGR